MDNLQTSNYENVLTIISRWPLSKRLTLLQDVLHTLTSELMVSDSAPTQNKRSTLKEAYGLLATEQPAPSDEEIQSWLKERRLEKYG